MNIDIKRHLKDALFMSDSELFDLAKTCPHRYKVYEIDKKNGGKRLIAHPSKELKYIQKLILDILKANLSIHHSAYAYVAEKNIKENASLHVNNSYLLKMDFKDFFPSITPGLFFDECEKHNIFFSKEDKDLLANILFWKKKHAKKLVLSIGAPSSPFISNFIMFSFDALISEYCNTNGIKYSRYADDLTFSTNKKEKLAKLPKQISEKLNTFYRKSIRINIEKTTFVSKACSRKVTGLVITNNNTISIGRERKRQISAMVHQYSIGKMTNSKDIEKLVGLVNFAIYIEPQFLNFLLKKYGREIVNSIYKLKNKNK
ncbi:retron St85 family RNA-directed DNA polymerase [Acinetobacter baumannii]|uniref:retron St85 family RNA-directed DNA polymerase n=1 Tax=Acinetobacter baumannii TaxID=470 RepID=UPI00148C73E5|nr:retron St85 family RNA-directed DNA polymerase [Acinetobacter baumannii]